MQIKYRLKKGIILEDICDNMEDMMCNGEEIKEIKRYLYNKELKISEESKDKIWERLMLKYRCLERAIQNIMQSKESLDYHLNEFNWLSNTRTKTINIKCSR